MRERKLLRTVLLAALGGSAALAQQPVTAPETFNITGTLIPADLLKMNYGPLPKGIEAYDLSICNVSEARHSLVSSAIFQALSEVQSTLRPIGSQIMLAAILRNQSRSVSAILTAALGSVTGSLSVLNMSRSPVAAGWGTGLALGALIAQKVLANWRPALTADQVEKFESQVLEPAIVMDGGSCVERTVFTAAIVPSKKPQSVQFHVR